VCVYVCVFLDSYVDPYVDPYVDLYWRSVTSPEVRARWFTKKVSKKKFFI